MDNRRWLNPTLAVATALASTTAGALTLGMSDSFDDGSAAGWAYGAASPGGPTVLDSGGPGGAADGYLQLVATGGTGPGSRLTVIAGPQWTGDYLASGVGALRFSLNNQGATDLNLRLWLAGAAGASVLSSQPLLLPAGSGWTTAEFSLAPAALSGPALAVLAGVQQLRLFHGVDASFPGQAISATLGLDRVTAVPEPGPLWLWLSGLCALLQLRRRRPARAG